MPPNVPDIRELEPGDTARIFYTSKRSGNEVEREGEVAELRESSSGEPLVYVHEEQDGFFDHSYVGLVKTETTEGEDCIAAISVSTEPNTNADERPSIGSNHPVIHSIGRKQTLGIAHKVVVVSDLALARNEVLDSWT